MTRDPRPRVQQGGKTLTPYVPLPRAARRLGVSLHRAIEMIHQRKLRALLSSGRWWVEAASLAALLRARQHFGPPSRGAA